MIKIAIYEPHSALLKANELLLNFFDDFQVALTNTDKYQLLETLKETQVDVFLFSYKSRETDNNTYLDELKRQIPTLKIIGFSSYIDKDFSISAINRNVRSLLLKNEDADLIETSIREVHQKGYSFNKQFKEEYLIEVLSQN
jgi:DNA-binding NarL/FixJ family response regulator